MGMAAWARQRGHWHCSFWALQLWALQLLDGWAPPVVRRVHRLLARVAVRAPVARVVPIHVGDQHGLVREQLATLWNTFWYFSSGFDSFPASLGAGVESML